MASSAALSSAESDSWHLAAVCLFWEHFIGFFPAAPHFNPQATSIKVWPFQRRGKARTGEPAEGNEDDNSATAAGQQAAIERRHDDNGSSSASASSLVSAGSDHDADLCRCYLGDCMHAVQLHIALLTGAGYKNVTVENWQKHFHDELDARREDWPTVQSILDREEQQRREAEDEELPIAKVKSKKRKAAVALAATDDSHNPVYSLHYHALSANAKAALLYLNTCWMLHDDNVHGLIAESQMRDTAASAYGQDDAGRRYWLFIHCEWGENRVHLYRETDGEKEAGYRWELLACNRDQLEEALAVLMVQTSADSRALAHRIQYEALEYMEREGRLAERRQRRAVRMDLDLHNIISADGDGDGGGGRPRRAARKPINYAELDAGEVDRIAEEEEDAAKTAATELADRRKSGRETGRRGRPSGRDHRQQQLEDGEGSEWEAEEEEEVYATAGTEQQEQLLDAEDHSQQVQGQHELQSEAEQNELDADIVDGEQQQARIEESDGDGKEAHQQDVQEIEHQQSHKENGSMDLRHASGSGEQTEQQRTVTEDSLSIANGGNGDDERQNKSGNQSSHETGDDDANSHATLS